MVYTYLLTESSQIEYKDMGYAVNSAHCECRMMHLFIYHAVTVFSGENYNNNHTIFNKFFISKV